MELIGGRSAVCPASLTWEGFVGLKCCKESHESASLYMSDSENSFNRSRPYARKPEISLSNSRSGRAQDVGSLLGPMAHERPLGASAAAAAASAAALAASRSSPRPLPPPVSRRDGPSESEEASPVQRAAGVPIHSRRYLPLSSSSASRIVDHIAARSHLTEADATVASVLDRVVECVSLRCAAGAAAADVVEALERHQGACFESEQRQAEESMVAQRLKRAIARKPAGRAPAQSRGSAQRQRIREAQAAAAIIDGRSGGGSRTARNAGVHFAEGALASSGSLYCPRQSSSADGVAAPPAAREHAAPRRRPSSVPSAPAGKHQGIGRRCGRDLSADFTYSGFSFASANIYSLEGAARLSRRCPESRCKPQSLILVRGIGMGAGSCLSYPPKERHIPFRSPPLPILASARSRASCLFLCPMGNADVGRGVVLWLGSCIVSLGGSPRCARQVRWRTHGHAGCGSEVVHKRIVEISRLQSDTVRGERKW
uniref:Uncharacterized protein n=1 Tax=Tetraselmis sp. GSL018 TaxID=582737 RepID=A0A061R505_9CHLO